MASYPWGPPSSSASFTPPGLAGQKKDGINALAERYAGMKEEIAAIRATASSPDRAVTVIAGPAGAVLDIKVNESAMSGSASQLSSAIMSALRLAVADGARQQAAVVQNYVGDRLNIAERVMSTQQELLGDKIKAGEEEEARQQQEQASGSVLDERNYEQPRPPAFQPPPSRPQPPQRPRHAPAYDDDDEGFQGIHGSEY